MIVRADFDALVAEAARLDGGVGDLNGRIASARSRVADLLEQGWTGEAATQFQPLFEAWQGAATSSVQRLDALIEGLRAATGDLVAAERSHEDAARALERATPSIEMQQLMGGNHGVQGTYRAAH